MVASVNNSFTLTVHASSDEPDSKGKNPLHNTPYFDKERVDTNNMTPPSKTWRLRPLQSRYIKHADNSMHYKTLEKSDDQMYMDTKHVEHINTQENDWGSELQVSDDYIASWAKVLPMLSNFQHM